MSEINWLEKLGWTEENIEDLRYTGFAYVRQGKYDIALNFFEALAILIPDNVYDAQTLGAIYLELNKPQLAMEHFDRALKLEAHHGPTLLNLSKTFFMLGRSQEALKICHILKNDKDVAIANVAKALILAYS